MRSIKQLISSKLDKEGIEFIDEISDVKDVWGLMMPTYRLKEHEGKGCFKMEVMPNIIGTVVQYKDGKFECNLNSIDFQAEYTEDELKEIIIEDIKYETMFDMVKQSTIGFMNKNEPILPNSQSGFYKIIGESTNKFIGIIKDCIKEIKEHDDDLTDLNKEE